MIILDYVALAIASFGVLIITWGIVLTAIRWLALELRIHRRPDACHRRESVRHDLGSYLLLGLSS